MVLIVLKNQKHYLLDHFTLTLPSSQSTCALAILGLSATVFSCIATCGQIQMQYNVYGMTPASTGG